MKRWEVVSLVIVIGVVSIAFFPLEGTSDQDQPVTVTVNNSANATQTFEVVVVELPSNVTVTWDNGKVEQASVGYGLSLNFAGDQRTIRAIEFPSSARYHGNSTLEPGEMNRSYITEAPSDFAVVVVVSQGENEIPAYVTASCNERALADIRVTSRPRPAGGASAAFNCV